MSHPTAIDIKNRLRPFGLTFEKSLTDLLKGIRSHREPEDQLRFLQQAVQECRKEVKSPDLEVKTMAVLKLAYLEMYGFDMTWANFQVLEVMSSPKFQQKRVGYLSSLQSFRNDNDVLMLMTNLLKKDLNSAKAPEVGVALSGIANIVTTPLAQDITEDIVRMLKHSKPYVRKKAVLTMYKIFLKYPDALRAHLDNLAERLNDEDESVVTATVTAVCELSKKTPTLLVPLAPRLYELLKGTNNNWMLIRLLKLFSSLCLVEPRLKQKLLMPVLELMSKTKASSLVFECVNCLVQGDMISSDDHEIARLCLEELSTFFQNNDSNLKFVGLLAFHRIGQINPDFIVPYAEHIFKFLEDDDQTIREKALDLVDGVVDDDNLFDVVKALMIQLIPEGDESKAVILSDTYKIGVIQKILVISGNDNYANLPSFEWYLSVLVDLLDLTILNNLPSQQIGQLIGEQIQNIAIRVPSVRKDVISISVKIINDTKYFDQVPEVFKDVIWVIGEYSNFIKNGDDLIRSILVQKARLASQLDHQILIVFIPALIKIYTQFVNKDGPEYWDSSKSPEIIDLTNELLSFLEPLIVNKNFEVQERASEFHEFLKLIPDAIEQHPVSASSPPPLLSQVLPGFFNSWEITPLAPGSQANIAKPFELDLDTEVNSEEWKEIREALRQEDEDLDIEGDEFEEDLFDDQGTFHHEEELIALDSEEDEEKKQRRLDRIREDPYYISSSPSERKKSKTETETVDNSDEKLPAVMSGFSIEVEDPKKLSKSGKTKKKKKNVVVLSNEVVGSPTNSGSTIENQRFKSLISPTPSISSDKKKKKLLSLDSSNLDNFTMTPQTKQDSEEISEEELRKLQDQLQQSTINDLQAQLNGGEEEVVVIRKKKKSSKKSKDSSEAGAEGEKLKKKKKKKAVVIEDK